MFYRDDCGYCHRAEEAMKVLKRENPEYEQLTIRAVEETKEPEFIGNFDYYAVPTYYVGDEKVFEAHIGMSDDEIKEEVKKVFDRALSE